MKRAWFTAVRSWPTRRPDVVYALVWLSGACGSLAILSAFIGGTTHNMTLTWAFLSVVPLILLILAHRRKRL